MLPEIVREWIDKAEEDYGFACAGMECTTYFAQICFHFQQAAEKYLKAFIVAKKLEFRPVHTTYWNCCGLAAKLRRMPSDWRKPVDSSTLSTSILATQSIGRAPIAKIRRPRPRRWPE